MIAFNISTKYLRSLANWFQNWYPKPIQIVFIGRSLCCAEKLGLMREDAKEFSTTQIYALAGINDKDYPVLTFDK